MRLPALLESLISEGRWPRSDGEALRQNGQSLVPIARLQAFAPDEERVYLYAPPFCSVADRVERGEEFWDSPMSAPDGLDRDRTIVIGDFGLGSDAPIVLDYRAGTPPPRVLRLVWDGPSRGQANQWVEVAPSFERFVELLGL